MCHHYGYREAHEAEVRRRMREAEERLRREERRSKKAERKPERESASW